MNMYDVFISYNWGIKKQVQQLYQVLTSLNYKVWMDQTELTAGSNSLTSEIATAIKNSKVFLSCITTDYCKSFNCNREIEYASAKKKQIIVLMVERLETATIDEIPITGHQLISGIGFIIG
jgi:hypothetical protein